MDFPGKCLGSGITDDQLASIRSGTFYDISLGDYWHIDGQSYYVVGFNFDNTPCEIYHVVNIPVDNLKKEE